LTAEVFSYSRVVSDPDENNATATTSLKFNVTIMDKEGNHLVEIKEFTMLRVSESVKGKIRDKDKVMEAAPLEPTKTEERKGKDFLKDGILPAEGIDAFNRILAGNLPQVIVSTTDLIKRRQQSLIPVPPMPSTEVETRVSSAPANPRPEISTVYVAPKTDMEKEIAAVWQSLLGIDRVGIHDDFFQLGGDSLNIVQLNTELKKKYKRDIPVAVMFKYQTIQSFTRYLQGGESTEETATEEIDRSEELKKSKNRLKERIRRR